MARPSSCDRSGLDDSAAAVMVKRPSMAAATRWTGPIIEGGAPPAIPRRNGRPKAATTGLSAIAEPQHAADIGPAARPAHAGIEGSLSDTDQMLLDEARALGGSLVRILQAALPFQRRPAVEAVARQAAENAAKIDITVAKTAEASGAVEPLGIAAIDPAAGADIEFGVLDVKGADPRVVAVDEAEIVDVLQAQMAGVVEDFRARMLID